MMLEINQQHIKRLKEYSILTIPKNMNYAGYKTLIPNRFITKNNFDRYINLSDNQKLKLKNNDKTIIVTIEEIKVKKNDKL